MLSFKYFFKKQIARQGYPNPLLNDEVIQRIKWLMIIRLITVTVIIGIGFVILKQPEPRIYLIPLGIIIALAYLFSGIYLIAFRIGLPVPLVMYFQIIFDALLISAIIHFSDGINSQFSLLYFLVILNASIFLHLRGSLIIATSVSVLYSALVSLEQTQILPSFFLEDLPGKVIASKEFVLLKVYLHLCFFYLLAFVSGYLAEREKTKGKKLEVATEELSRIKFDTGEILRRMSGGVISIDYFGRIMTFNNAAEKILGFKEELIRGKFCLDIFQEEFPEFGEFLMNCMKETSSDISQKMMLKKTDNTYIPLRISTSTLGDLNNKRGLIVVFEDLTEEQRLQEQIQRSERLAAIGSLAASIAHEIRNPLASISGSVQYLVKELQLVEDNERLMNLIVKESNRLNTIIGDFLMFARIKPGNKDTIEMNTILNDVIELLKKHEKLRKGIEIKISAPPQKLYVEGDEDQIKQMLFNIALNAFDAMQNVEKGLLTINIAAIYTDKMRSQLYFRKSPVPKGFAQIAITDNGVGIDKNILEKIFEPFYTTKKKGTGLGLAIVNRIVDNHNGWIDIKSNVNEGTTFYVYLPLSQTK